MSLPRKVFRLTYPDAEAGVLCDFLRFFFFDHGNSRPIFGRFLDLISFFDHKTGEFVREFDTDFFSVCKMYSFSTFVAITLEGKELEQFKGHFRGLGFRVFPGSGHSFLCFENLPLEVNLVAKEFVHVKDDVDSLIR